MPWNINIEAPNGATAHFVFDEEKSTDPAKAMTKQFGELVSQMREHDPEPISLGSSRASVFTGSTSESTNTAARSPKPK
jgi:hypothetical protein